MVFASLTVRNMMNLIKKINKWLDKVFEDSEIDENNFNELMKKDD